MSNVQNDADQQSIDPVAAGVIAKVRRLMLISSLTMVIGIGVILAIIGYRVFNAGGSTPAADATVALPSGARVVSTSIAEGRLAVTVEHGGVMEVRLFDLKTLQPVGRLRLTPSP